MWERERGGGAHLKSESKFLALNLKIVGVSPLCIRFVSFRYHI